MAATATAVPSVFLAAFAEFSVLFSLYSQSDRRNSLVCVSVAAERSCRAVNSSQCAALALRLAATALYLVASTFSVVLVPVQDFAAVLSPVHAIRTAC